MRFQATVVLNLEARSIGEAGAKLNEVVEYAKGASKLDVLDVRLGTAPRSEPVTLPMPISPPGRDLTPPPPAPPTPSCASTIAAIR